VEKAVKRIYSRSGWRQMYFTAFKPLQQG